ncbi:GH39 family glycosyl hydrolase [Cohnella soli]|uniref:Fibronectin type III domain-containing protein n=1 Tax=Cohnella soli TaxID=425005 RepID=A0ABW0HVB1_9BACL
MIKRKAVSAILCPFLLLSMVLGLFPGISTAAAGVQLTFDLNAQGQTLTNKFYDLSAWDLNEQWTTKADGQDADYFSSRYPFIKRVQLMIATGGCYIGYPGCNTNRDLFADPSDKTKLNDYKFDSLIQATGNIVKQGLKPYIVTGNVPIKLSSKPVLGPFQVNVRPPADYEQYYNYIKAMGDALVAKFGEEELKSWQWGVVQEYENRDMFLADDESSESTRIAYFKLYDYTVAALQDSIGSANLTVGAHAMAVSPGLWSQLEFIDHVAKGKNYKTGKIGTQIDFLTGSYYDQKPGVGAPASKSLEHTINLLRSRALQNGLTGLKFGIDEGRILQGPDGKDLLSRVVGHSFQAAADARLFKQLQDWNVDWFSMWGMNTEGVWGGADSVSAHIANLSYKMVGGKQLNPVLSGSPAGTGNEVGGVGGFKAEEDKLHLMVYNYNADMNAEAGETPAITIKNIAPASGNTVTVKQWTVDDTHGNFWPAWWSDQASRGLQDGSYNVWSKYSVEVPSSLKNEADREYWYSKEEGYKKRAELASTTRSVAVKGGSLTLYPDMGHHGVVFFEITNAKSTGTAQIVTDDLNDWTRSYAHSDGLIFDTGNAALLGDPSRVMRKGPFPGPGAESVTYKYANMASLSATALFASSSEAISDYKFYASADGEKWTEQFGWKSQDTPINDGLWTKRKYTLGSLPGGTQYVKIEFPAEAAYFYSPQLAQVQIVYANTCACADNSVYADDLNDWSVAHSHTVGLGFDTLNGEALGDPSRVMRTDNVRNSSESITYRFDGMSAASVSALFASGSEPIADFKFFVSADGSKWTEHAKKKTAIHDAPISGKSWTQRLYTLADLPSDTAYLKIEFPKGGKNSWNPQLGRVEIRVKPKPPTELKAATAGMTKIRLSWTASSGAGGYNVYRADSANGVYKKVNDHAVSTTAYEDSGLSAGGTYFYKVTSLNNVGESAPSAAASATTSLFDVVTLTDELNDWSIASSHSSGLQFDTLNADVLGDPSRVMRKETRTEPAESVVYRMNGMTGAFVNGLFASSTEPISDFIFYVSPNGTDWTKLSKQAAVEDKPITSVNWTDRKYALNDLPSGTNYLKIEFPAVAGAFWNPQLSRVELTAKMGATTDKK